MAYDITNQQGRCFLLSGTSNGVLPGDYRVAEANQCLFFPINPAAEETSWKRLLEEGIGHFLNGTFAGDYQAVLLKEFDATLPDQPPWPVAS